ncbi:hypothetical protein Hanom_Chr12g01139111 [Helianthus anomalus]
MIGGWILVSHASKRWYSAGGFWGCDNAVLGFALTEAIALYRSGRRLGWGRSSLIILLQTFWYVLPPNYRSDPADEKENSALVLSRRTYPPRDSWNFYGLRWGKSTKARQIDRLLSRC